MEPTSKSGVVWPPPEGQAAVGRSDPGAGEGGVLPAYDGLRAWPGGSLDHRSQAKALPVSFLL